MLLAQKAYVEGGLALTLYCARLVDEEKTAEDSAVREDAKLLLDILTPIAKSWPSQWCPEHCSSLFPPPVEWPHVAPAGRQVLH